MFFFQQLKKERIILQIQTVSILQHQQHQHQQSFVSLSPSPPHPGLCCHNMNRRDTERFQDDKLREGDSTVSERERGNVIASANLISHRVSDKSVESFNHIMYTSDSLKYMCTVEIRIVSCIIASLHVIIFILTVIILHCVSVDQ